MFYCDKCSEEKKLPQMWLKSYGICEICGKTKECNNDSD